MAKKPATMSSTDTCTSKSAGKRLSDSSAQTATIATGKITKNEDNDAPPTSPKRNEQPNATRNRNRHTNSWLASGKNDDGRVTDSQGRTVDFKNTIIIMTSNLGSQYLLEGINENGEIAESAKEMVMAQLRQQFRPEFLNRLDEILCFKPLTKSELEGIIDILTSSLRARLEEKSLGLEITEEAKQLIIDRGFDPVFGARPLKRYLQSAVETLIAKEILAGDIPAGHTIRITVRDGELACE